jgi:hypothetical protein
MCGERIHIHTHPLTEFLRRRIEIQTLTYPRRHTQIRTHIHALSHITITPTIPHTLTDNISLYLSRTRTHTRHTHSLKNSLSLTHMHTLTHIRTPTHSLTPTHTHNYSLSLCFSNTHTQLPGGQEVDLLCLCGPCILHAGNGGLESVCVCVWV